MSKSIPTLLRLAVFSAIAVGSISFALGQGTENLPNGHHTKNYELLGVPPTDIEPVSNPTDSNPGGTLGPPSIPSLAVPEPTTTALIIAGAGLFVGAAMRRRRRR
jgi:hypothetical protein